MRSVILYATTNPSIYCRRDYTEVVPAGGTKPIFIRGRVVACDAATALDRAKPRVDETVLNTIELS